MSDLTLILTVLASLGAGYVLGCAYDVHCFCRALKRFHGGSRV